MSDDAVRRALASLARSDGPEGDSEATPPQIGEQETFRETIERSTAAIDDLEAAAQFVEEGGLERLERAVEQAERSVSASAVDGQRALETFREFEEAADGVRASRASAGSSLESDGVRASEASAGSIGDRGESIADHFHPGHGTSLGGGDIARSK